MPRYCLAGPYLLAWAGFVQPLAAQITAQPAAVRPPAAFNPTYPSFSPSSPPLSPVVRTSSAPPSVPQSPEANTIRGWYRDYLGRDVGLDLAALVNLLRGGMSPIDLQATILGSDEYYYQKGRDPQAFVRQTLQAVTWSEPSYAEVQRWTARLVQLRNDRFALAREILLEAQSPLAEAQAWREVASRLPSAARLAVDTIQFEIPGTPQGREANLQAAALLDAVNRLDQLPQSARAQDTLAALDSADRSLTALQTTLSNPPGAAPSAASIVRRIGTMLAETRTAISPPTTTPRPSYPAPGGSLPPANPSSGSWHIIDQVAATRRAAESLIQVLTSQAYQDYTYTIVLRDLDTLASRLAGLEALARTNPSRDRLAIEVQSLADSSQRVEAQLAGSRLPYAARLYWESLESNLAELRETTGTGGSTVSLRPSAWHESLLPLLDQAAAQIDVFLAGTAPLVYRLAEVPSIQADARSLRTRVMLLREQAGYGQPAAALKQTLASMVGDYTAAFDRWNRVVAANRLTSPARLSPVGETLNRVEQIINDALTSGGTSAGSSAANLQLAQLQGELAEAQRACEALAGYREQPAIHLYLEQLAGYVQQLEDAGQGRSPTDARRLAVGMQGVVGRLLTDVTTLERRATGTWQQHATHLRFHTERIGRLVDEVEGLLY
jgi:hypothetical protein